MLSCRPAHALRGLAVVAVAALVPMVAGCEAGGNAPTQRWHQPTPGASGAAGPITINNVFVLGAPPQSALTPGTSASLFLALTNESTSTDRLVSISAPGSATSVPLPKGGIRLAARQTVLMQGPKPTVVLQDLTRRLNGGQSIPLVLNFQNAGSVTLHVPVMPRAASYATYSPAPATPSASPRATP